MAYFDGISWTTGGLLNHFPAGFFGSLRQSRDGAIWLNRTSIDWYNRSNPAVHTKAELYHLRAVRYRPDTDPPDTEITHALDRVSQPGNTPVSWKGADPWRVTAEEDLQYSWQVDGGEWSPYSTSTSRMFLALSSGDHTFEVRARDRDFNVDTTPAAAHFTVVPPVWRQGWFVGMVVLFVTGIGVQTGRVVGRGKRLREANAELERRVAARTLELSKANRSLLTLSECNQVLVRAEGEAELIGDVCRILVEIGGYRLAWVGYAEQDEEKTVRPAGHRGHEAGYLDTLNVTWSDTEAGHGPTGLAIRTGESVVVQDIGTDPRYGPWRTEALARGYASSIGLPLRAGEEVLGVLRIYAGEPNAFLPDEVRLLEELANDLAYGILALRIREEHRRAEEALRETQTFSQTVLNASPDVIYVYDIAERRNVYSNDGILKVLGYSTYEIQEMGDELIQLLMHPDDYQAYLNKILPLYQSAADNEFIEHEYRMKHKNDRWCWLHSRESIFARDPAGNPRQIFGMIVDITERRQAEEELRTHRERLEELVAERTADLGEKTRELEDGRKALTYLLEDVNEAREGLEEANAKLQAANAELDEFAYVVSHDLKAPLRGVSQLADWLATDYADALDDEGREMLSLMIARIGRMYGLIDGVLAYSRIGRIKGREERVDLHRLVEETVGALAVTDHVGITIDGRLPAVAGDRVRLGQVWQNLIGNAVRFMDKPEGRIRVSCADGGAFWSFSVEDNGMGIEARHQDRIFRIFQTLAPRDELESTGIGLTLVKKIVELHGGEVRVESVPGHGSTFTFTLPKERG